jgi:hypothetical protein
MNAYPRIFVVLSLCSSSSLAFEIALTRIFSITLWYHFAFMIISIAMLGMGASGTLLSLSPRLKDPDHIGIYSLLLGVGISLSYVIANQIPFDPVKLSWSETEILYIGLYCAVISLPFFFAGLIVSSVLSSMSGRAGLFYGADLLGAGAGSMGILSLMTLAGPEKIIFFISSAALSAAFIAGGKRVRIISAILISLNLALLFLNPPFLQPRMSPYKGLQVAMRYPGAEHIRTYFSPHSRIDVFKSPAVRFAPGMSLQYLDALPEQLGISIDGGQINAITKSGDQSSMEFLEYLPSALPYEVIRPSSDPLDREETGTPRGKAGSGDLLILDPGGGLQVLVADRYGFSNVFKIERNPLLMDVINKDFREFSGGIYLLNTWSGLGRSWLRSAGRKFDIIDIQMMGASPSGSFGISEDYRFTVEAFKEYLGHLSARGLISINLFILPPSRTELRLLTTAVSAMDELGIRDVERHVAAIRSWGSLCILVKRSPFTAYETDTVRKFAKERRFDLIYYPGISQEETNIFIRMPSNEYLSIFRKILNPDARNQFINTYLFDINPVRDENPFFHYYLKLKNIRETYKVMGEKWQYFLEEGYILPAVLIQVLTVSLILILLPAFSGKNRMNLPLSPFSKDRIRGFDSGLSFLPYFLFLGIGFMFVEVSLIHKMILPLENPSYAVATVLTSMLISAGIGSLLSYRISFLRNPLTLMGIPILIVSYSIFLPILSSVISPHPLMIRILLVFSGFIPLGLLMGIPFPTGLKMLSERNASLIPWAWAINSCFSVLAPILTVMLAVVTGFKTVLWLGALMYLLAFFTLIRFSRKTR